MNEALQIASLKGQVAALTAERDRLVADLEWFHASERDGALSGPARALRDAYDLTPSEARMLAMIARRGRATHDAIYCGLYASRSGDEQPFPKIISVFLRRLRQKLKPHSIRILTIHGEGYVMPDGDRAVVRKLMGECEEKTKQTEGEAG